MADPLHRVAAARAGASRFTSGVSGALREGGTHFVATDGPRFPICGSWRSNWSHTAERDRATCPHCLARLASPPPPAVPDGET